MVPTQSHISLNVEVSLLLVCLNVTRASSQEPATCPSGYGQVTGCCDYDTELRVPLNARNYVTVSGNVSSLRRALLHRVS